jgi:MetJ family methionine regulon transcriptional repressor
MHEWKGQYINPYVEHGKKNELSKKFNVTVPIKVLEILTHERERRKKNNLKHASFGELFCESFLHAYTGQSLPTDDDLKKK